MLNYKLKQEAGSVWFWLSAAALVVLLVFIVWPVLRLVAASVWTVDAQGHSGWWVLANETRYLRAVANTIGLSLVVTLLTTLIGVPLAYFTARYKYPLISLVALLPLITLIIPEVIAAQTWLMMLGNNGLITRSVRDWGVAVPSFYGWPGLIIVMTFTYYAYVYIGTLAAIRGFDSHLEEAAQSLGTTPQRSRWLVTFPVILPAILASALLVFTLVAGNFATASILGHQVQLLSVLTYQASVAEVGASPVMQSTLASVSIFIVLCVLFIQRRILARGRYEIVQGRGVKPVALKGYKSALLAGAVGLLVAVSLLPLVTLVVGSFTVARGPVMKWGQWTTAHIERAAFAEPTPIVNSIIYAGSATVIGICFSILISYLIVKKRNVLTPAIDYLSALPLALSGTVIGIGLLMSFNGGWLSLAGTSGILVLAYVIRRLQFGIRNAQSTLYNVPNSIEDASISLGVAPIPSFFKVVFPLMLPAIMAATILIWTTTVAELSASVIVYSAGRETLPIQIFRLIDSGLMAYASAYGLILISVIVIPIIIATKVFRISLFSE